MDDSFEVIETQSEDPENLRWEEDLKVLKSKGLNNRNLLLNLLGELGSAENVFHYLRSSPKNEPRAVEQEETPEGSPLLASISSVQIDDYFCDDRLNSDFEEKKKEEEEETTVDSSSDEKNKGPASPMILPPSFQIEDSKEPDNSLPKALSPTFKKFNSVIPYDMGASFLLSSPLLELIKPSNPCVPLNLDGTLEDFSESPSLPIQLCKCVNDGITILPKPPSTKEEEGENEETKSKISTKEVKIHETTNNNSLEKNLNNQCQIDSKGLLTTRLRQHKQLNIYIHFTDFFLAVLLTTFVWWTWKEIYLLRETVDECQKIVQSINSTVHNT